MKPLSREYIAALKASTWTFEQLVALLRKATAEELAQEFEAHAAELEEASEPTKAALAKIARANAAYVRDWASEG